MNSLLFAGRSWLPDMDLNHDKQIQSLLCYRYTIGQASAFERLNLSFAESSGQTTGSESRKTVARGVSRGSVIAFGSSTGWAKETLARGILPPLRCLNCFDSFIPRLTPRATVCRRSAASRISHHALRCHA